MTGIPELSFTYDAATCVLSARCSLCGREMPINLKGSANSSDDIKWFAAQFDLHMKQKHLPEYKIHGRREV